MSDKPQTIFRISKDKDNPYVMLDKRPLADNTLSWKAKGIWSYLMSKPDNWTVILEDIINHATEGAAAVRSGIKELQQAGYMKKAQLRDDQGIIHQHLWLVFEQPQDPDMGVSILRLSTSGLSTSGSSTSGKSNTTNIDSNNNNHNDKEIDDPENTDTWKQVVDAYVSLSGTISPFIAKSLEQMGMDWAEHQTELPASHPDKTIHPHQVLILAIQEMGKHITRPNLKYLEKILASWRESGINSKGNKPQSAYDPNTYDSGKFADFIES